MMTGGTAYHVDPGLKESPEGVLDCLSVGFGDRRYKKDAPALAPRAFGLYYVIQGQGSLETEFHGNSTLRPGDVFFRMRGERSRVTSQEASGRWWIYWVVFRGSALQTWQGALIPRGSLVWRLGASQRLVDLFERLVGVMRFQLRGHREEASALLLQIITVAYLSNLRRSSGSSDILSDLLSAMHEAVRQPSFDVEAFCLDTKIAYHTLRRQFREHTGRAPHQYFLDLKLAEARSLLLEHPEMTATEIAYHLSYDDPHYFTRLFTKRVGLPPGQFREHHSAE